MTDQPPLSNPTLPPSDVRPVLHKRVGARIRNYFLTGLVLVGPVFVTAYLTWSFITWVDGGPLDCESWPTRTLLGALHLHKSAVEMVRIRAAQDERV